ncbi:RES domain-containing protein [Streptomyces sp. 8K308]|uniref:RES family NAD+ phosphorylase n=1 Tax=Streptomyces sp. 8K308 TaxID=2530388 RepID=UPI00104DF091|nr:RES family NAD+ phosphorylase [Streptomyces sp. 8K308]TDC19995.1 RES domain-containing protein [Streptomyces sp. 8K308]
MPRARPPESLPGTPTRVVLPAGTRLFRVHSATRSGTAANPVPSHCLWGGGRFDATACDRYGYLYAGLTAEAAVCETLLRSIPFDPSGGPRLLPYPAVRGRRLSFLRLARPVTVVSLMGGRDLAAVGQDSWLVQTESAEYPFTRDWGHWVRSRTGDWAQGFVWPSKREPAHRALVLFADRYPPDAVADTGEPPVDLSSEEGVAWLNDLLEPYGTLLAPPVE